MTGFGRKHDLEPLDISRLPHHNPEVAIASVHEKVRGRRLVDTVALDFARKAAARLADVVRQRLPVPL